MSIAETTVGPSNELPELNERLSLSDKFSRVGHNLVFLRARLRHTSDTFDGDHSHPARSVAQQIEVAQEPDLKLTLEQVDKAITLLKEMALRNLKHIIKDNDVISAYVKHWALGQLVKTDNASPRTKDETETLRRAFFATQDYVVPLRSHSDLQITPTKSTEGLNGVSVFHIRNQGGGLDYGVYSASWNEKVGGLFISAPSSDDKKPSKHMHELDWKFNMYSPSLG